MRFKSEKLSRGESIAAAALVMAIAVAAALVEYSIGRRTDLERSGGAAVLSK